MLSSHFGFGEECGGAITTYSQFLIDPVYPSVVGAYVCVSVCILVHLCVHAYACMYMWKTGHWLCISVTLHFVALRQGL